MINSIEQEWPRLQTTIGTLISDIERVVHGESHDFGCTGVLAEFNAFLSESRDKSDAGAGNIPSAGSNGDTALNGSRMKGSPM